jgi:hypothetical protein
VTDGDAGRDQAIANLEDAYVALDYQEYERLIHDDFVFLVDPTEIDIVGAEELSAAEDLASTQHMFSQEVGSEKVLDEYGRPTGGVRAVPPVASVDIDLSAESASEWEMETSGRFEGAHKRVYDVNMTVECQGGERTDHVVGLQTFHLKATTQTRRIGGEDVEVEVWQIVGWEDQGTNSGG